MSNRKAPWVDFEKGLLRFDDGVVPRDVPREVAVNIKDFKAQAQPGVDCQPAFQAAHDALPYWGGRIIVPAAPYPWHMDSFLSITKDYVEIVLEDGAHVEKDPNTTAAEPFIFQGTAPTTWDDLTADPDAGDVTIDVTTPGNFAVGDWIKIRDDEPPSLGGTSQHEETNRIRSISGSTLTLEYPLCDDYVTITAVAPSAAVFVPQVGGKLTGPGKITNGDPANPDAGNAGVRFKHAAFGKVEGVEFMYCQQDAVRFFNTFVMDASHNYCHDANDFDASGRGIVASMSQHLVIANNRLQRLRHCTDISNWCRYVLIEGNVSNGGGADVHITHPDVKWMHVTGNMVSGVQGFAAGTADWGTTYAQCISLQTNTHHVQISDNTIANGALAGIVIQRDNITDVTIRGNHINNLNMVDGQLIYAGIGVWQLLDTQGATEDGIVIEDNTILDCSGRGIFLGGRNISCKKNFIRDIRDDGGANVAGILVRPWVQTGTAAGIANITVEGNTIENVTGGRGIHVGVSATEIVTETSIKRNTIRNCDESGIYALPHNIDGITIQDNEIRDCGSGTSDAGILVGLSGTTDNACGAVLIERNTIWMGTTMRRGIYASVNDAIVRHNIVKEAGGANALSIYIACPATAMTTTGVILDGNIIDGPAFGLYIGDNSGVGDLSAPLLIRNIVLSTTSDDVRVNALTTNCTLIDNIANDVNDNGSTTIRYVTHFDVTNFRFGVGTVTPSALAHVAGKCLVGGELEVDGALNHDGTTVGLNGVAPVARSTGWAESNVTTDKVFDANSLTLHELADVVGTLVAYFKSRGDLGA